MLSLVNTGIYITDQSHINVSNWPISCLITEQTRPDQVHLFLTESCMMLGLIHQNIYPVIGACINSTLPPFVIYPHSSEGNLKKFLLKCRVSETGSHYVSLNLSFTQVHLSIRGRLIFNFKLKFIEAQI